MKSVVTAWKAGNLVFNVQLPIFHMVFLLFLSRLGGRQSLGWPVILSHETFRWVCTYDKCHWRPMPFCRSSWRRYQRPCQKAPKRYPVLFWSPSSTNFFPSVKIKPRISCLGSMNCRGLLREKDLNCGSAGARSWGTATIQGVLRKICCNFRTGGILLFRNSMNAMSVMFMCYLDLFTSFSLHCELEDALIIQCCQTLARIVILNSY